MGIEDLAALEYSGQGATQTGITGDDFRVYHGQHAETVRWWKGYQAPDDWPGVEDNGRIYVEQTLDGDTHFAWFSETHQEVTGAEFGLLPRGSTRISCIPARMELARGDRVLRIELQLIARAVIYRGYNLIVDDAATDELPHHFVQAISVVMAGGAVIEPERYRISQDAKNRGIEWLLDPPADGTAYSLEWKYAPLLYFAGTENRPSPKGNDDLRVLQRGIAVSEMVR